MSNPTISVDLPALSRPSSPLTGKPQITGIFDETPVEESLPTTRLRHVFANLKAEIEAKKYIEKMKKLL